MRSGVATLKKNKRNKSSWDLVGKDKEEKNIKQSQGYVWWEKKIIYVCINGTHTQYKISSFYHIKFPQFKLKIVILFDIMILSLYHSKI